MLGAVPELPEAERARAALEGVVGRVVADADDSDTFVCRPFQPGHIREALVGHRVLGVRRIGKQLLVETDGPVLGVHLGMSGSIRLDDDPAMRFTRFSLAFTDGGNVVLRDPRRLGRVTLDPVDGRLGPDAMAVPLDRFRDLVGRSRAPVKARLLDQQAVAGVGNLLADDLTAIKEIVYEMRFDEVTAGYGRFGPFMVGLTCQLADLPARLGLVG